MEVLRSRTFWSMLTISSPRITPALELGLPAIGEITMNRSFRTSTSTPIPPNSPLRSSWSASLSLDSRYSECGSSVSTMPWIAERARAS